MKEDSGWVRKATARSTAHSSEAELRIVFMFMDKDECVGIRSRVGDEGPAGLGIQMRC
jgi:hypothetical protein